MAAVLELRSVTRRFGAHTAVDNISMCIEPGTFFGLLGPSGCGKTTTLRLIAGFEVPDEGEVLLDGRDIGHLAPYERPVSTVFQNYALFPHLTVRGNIEFGLRRRKTAPPEIARRVAAVVDMVRLGGKEDRKPHQLSGGERQRVALARSLVLEPSVLLLDEPLSALDPGLRHEVRLELKAIQRRVATTFIFVTHDREEALSLSDRIAVMNSGAIEQIGTPQELYLMPRTRFVASFLGPVNWVAGTGVRPEATRVSRTEPVNGTRSARCVVQSCTFFGSCFHVHARTAAGETVIAEVPRSETSYEAGDRVHMWWQPSDELPELQG